MHVNSVLVGALALSGTALAMPLSRGNQRMGRIPLMMSRHGSREWPKITSPSPSNSTSHGPQGTDARPEDLCKDLCGLQSQACVLALPQDEAFCRETYVGCSERCQ